MSDLNATSQTVFAVILHCTSVTLMLFAPVQVEAQSPRSDPLALSAIFAEQHVEDAALDVHQRAAALPIEDRYKYLANWVLPGPDHPTLRLALDFLPTNAAPPVAESYSIDAADLQTAIATGQPRLQTGGDPVSPAVDLIDAASQLGRLDELRSQIEQATADGELQQRCRLAMLLLTDVARNDFPAALAGLDELSARVRHSTFESFVGRSPETLVLWVAVRHLETREATRDLLFRMLQDQVRSGYANGPERWDRGIAALAGRVRHFERSDSAGVARGRFSAAPALRNWAPVGRTTALTRGRGFPRTHWRTSPGEVEKLAGHNEDYLLYRIPLRGNFEVECEVSGFGWRDSHLSVAGTWVAPIATHTSYGIGGFRSARPSGNLDPRLSEAGEWIRYRVVVRDGNCTTYFNGRPIHREPLPADHDPWLAIRSPWFAQSAVRGLRITGDPVVPQRVRISALADLRGWTAYYDESAGGAGSDWRQLGDLESGGGIVGRHRPELAGSNQESLLRYQRPMLEDGTIDYEFYYREGRSHVHPALDRRAFILHPDGVRIHWITDGVYDRTDLDPANVFAEPENRRGPDELPLNLNDWNRLRLALTGDTVELMLNDQLVYRGALEPANQRTFGLFHYSDRTEARVRNVVWTGDWPRALPSVADQELAGPGIDFLDERGRELNAEFRYDFARDGLSEHLLGVYGRDWKEHIAAKPDGLQVSAPCLSEYTPTYVSPKLRVHGDFDIVAAFDGLKTVAAEEGSSGISLRAILEHSDDEQCTVYRGLVRRSGANDQQLVQSFLARKMPEGTRMTFHDMTSEEATSGRLRLARRGDRIYCLFAEGDSSYYRLITQETLSGGSLRLDGVRLTTATQGLAGLTRVVWKSLTIRAERITDLPIQDSEKLLKELDRQRAAMATRFRHDFSRDATTDDRFERWGGVAAWRLNPQGLRVVAPGRDNWFSSGLALRRRLRGDFDVAVSFETPLFAKPKEGDNSAVFLQVRLPEETTTNADAILMQQPDGSRQVAAELMTPAEQGNKFRRLADQSVTSVARLRIARRGKELFFLFADDATGPFQVFARTECTDREIPVSSIRTFAHTGGAGRQTHVLYKVLEIHAEEIVEPSK